MQMKIKERESKSGYIKDTLYAKAAEKIETLRKEVSDSMFETEPYNPKGGMETETETEVETEPTEEPEE